MAAAPPCWWGPHLHHTYVPPGKDVSSLFTGWVHSSIDGSEGPKTIKLDRNAREVSLSHSGINQVHLFDVVVAGHRLLQARRQAVK